MIISCEMTSYILEYAQHWYAGQFDLLYRIQCSGVRVTDLDEIETRVKQDMADSEDDLLPCLDEVETLKRNLPSIMMEFVNREKLDEFIAKDGLEFEDYYNSVTLTEAQKKKLKTLLV